MVNIVGRSIEPVLIRDLPRQLTAGVFTGGMIARLVVIVSLLLLNSCTNSAAGIEITC